MVHATNARATLGWSRGALLQFPRVCTAVSALLFSSLFAACMPLPVVEVSYFESSGAFRSCTVSLNWDENELIRECGTPHRKFASRNEGETECLLYRSIAHSPWLNSGMPPTVLACLGRPDAKTKERTVDAIYFLQTDGKRSR